MGATAHMRGNLIGWRMRTLRDGLERSICRGRSFTIASHSFSPVAFKTHNYLSPSGRDAVANDLHSVITFADEGRPALFWKIFLAFDEGEYRHRNDEPEADPVERYTRPMLTEILSEHAVEQTK